MSRRATVICDACGEEQKGDAVGWEVASIPSSSEYGGLTECDACPTCWDKYRSHAQKLFYLRQES